MLRISGIKLNMGEGTELLPAKIAKKLKIKKISPKSWKIVKESVDARKKPDLYFVYTVDFEADNEREILSRAARVRGVSVSIAPEYVYEIPKLEKPEKRPVVVGFGPAGMFASLVLAQAGLCPIVLERGKDADSRTRDVERFWQTGKLNTSSNVQFGEGGAGTFSDGKLTTGIKDERIMKVKEELILAGADPSIAYSQTPHIGTDVLREAVKKIRKKIISLGGEVRFESKVTNIITEDSGTHAGRRVKALIINESERLECESVIFAPGNAARDTFRMLFKNGVSIIPKPFSVGVRIEHPQSFINLTQYGMQPNDEEGRLGAASYKLAYHTESGRGVYTFCMCPGGYVVGAASDENMVVTNGMSYRDRAGENANSALLVDVRPSDYNATEENPLAGIDFQESIEKKAYILGGGKYFAPVQSVGDFLKTSKKDADIFLITNEKDATAAKKNGGASEIHDAEETCCDETEKRGGAAKATGSGFEVKPTYRPGVRQANIEECLPAFVTEALREAIPNMARRMRGFDMNGAILTGVETRSSCPVRIERTKSYESVSVAGLYPGGEGAGYAGGIMSAAVDGMRLAEKIIERALLQNSKSLK